MKNDPLEFLDKPEQTVDKVPKVYQAICNVTGALSLVGIAKDRKNTQQGYAFRGIDDIYTALSRLLAEHHLCILPRVVHRELVERTTKSGGALFYTTLTVEFDFVSTDDGSKHTVVAIGEAMDSADKSSNKAMSAAYKYACLQTFCIPTEGDNDADATTHSLGEKTSAEIVKTRALSDNQVADLLAAIDSVESDEALKRVWTTASNLANTAGDAQALEKFTKAKNKKYRSMHPVPQAA